MGEIDKNPTGTGNGDQDRASNPSTFAETDAPPQQPAEVTNADSPGPTSEDKPYLEAIDATGARTQKMCLLAIGVLTVLFFGLLLPSLGALQSVRELRAEQDHITFQIGIQSRKMEARRAAIKRGQRARAFFANDPGSDQKGRCGKDTAEALKNVKKSLASIANELATQISDRNRKENLAKFVRERGRDVDLAIREIERSQDEKENAAEKKSPDPKNGPSLAEGNQAVHDKDNCLRTSIRELRDGLGLLKLKAQQADVADRVYAESIRTIPLGFLGLFGLKLDGLNEARVPLLYLPLFWSLLLLAVFLYASQARSSMLNMYARALCMVDRSALLKGLGPLSRSRWWWLAPLPKRDGRKVSALALKSALGWVRFELVAILGVVLLHAGLLAMQAIVVLISWRATPLLTGGGELLLISIANGLLALWSAAIVFQWLWTRRAVPDFDANEEAPWHYRRTVVSMLVIGVAGGLLLRRLAPATERPQIHTAPRFRKKRPRRAIVVNDEPLSEGFYLNKCTKIIHYVSLRRFPQPAHPRERRKRRRIRLLRIESRQRQSDWNVNSTKRPRETTLARRVGKPEQGNPNDKMLREVWRMNRTPERFVRMEDGSDLPHAASRIKQPGTYKCSSDAPSLHGSQAPFAVEQEVLRRLAVIKQTPNISIEQAASARSQLCDLLKAAISDRHGPSYFRLHDLLAVVALQNNREDILKWLIDSVAESSIVGMKARARRWAPGGKWRSRWSPTQDLSYKHKRKEWAGLPM